MNIELGCSTEQFQFHFIQEMKPSLSVRAVANEILYAILLYLLLGGRVGSLIGCYYVLYFW